MAISKLQVLKSNAGYYIGRTQDFFPYSRDSGYYPTKESAQQALDQATIRTSEDAWTLSQ